MNLPKWYSGQAAFEPPQSGAPRLPKTQEVSYDLTRCDILRGIAGLEPLGSRKQKALSTKSSESGTRAFNIFGPH